MGKVILYKLLMGVWSMILIPDFYVTDSEMIVETSVEASAESMEKAVGELAVIEEEPEREKPVVSEQPQMFKKWARISSEWDEIFAQPEEYPENLLKNLKRNPEILDFVYHYPDASLTAAGGMTAKERVMTCPLLMQWDSRWGYVPYGSYNIGISGCGPTCLSMVIYRYLREESITPDVLAAKAMDGGYYVKDQGTAWTFLVDVPKEYGLNVQQCSSLDEAGMIACLENDGLMVCSMKPGDFTDTGHFIVICRYDDEGFTVNDPFSYTNSYKKWDYETLVSQIKQVWCYSKGE